MCTIVEEKKTREKEGEIDGYATDLNKAKET